MQDAYPTTDELKDIGLRLPGVEVELDRIVSEMSDMLTDLLRDRLARGRKPAQIANDMVAGVKAHANRARQMASWAVVKAYNGAVLDELKRQGVTHVGVVPEHHRHRAPSLANGLNDTEFSDAARNTPQQRHSVTGQFRARGKFERTKPQARHPKTGKFVQNKGAPYPWKIRRSKRAKAALESMGEVEVVTADDPCDVCQEIADSGPYPIDEAMDLIPAHPHCLPGDSLVLARSGVTATSERWFAGELVVIRTACGRELSCTPNHPILTDRGWLPAHELDVGCNVVSDGGIEWESPSFVDDDHQHVPTCIQDIARSFLEAPQMLAMEVPTASPDFHGDGINGEVAIIRADRELWRNRKSTPAKHPQKLRLIWRDMIKRSLVADRLLCQFLQWTLSTTRRIMSRLDLSLTLLVTHGLPFQRFSFALAAWRYACLDQNAAHNRADDAEGLGNLVLRLSGLIGREHFRSASPQNLGFGFVGISKRSLNSVPSDVMLAHQISHGQTGPVFLDNVVSVRHVNFSGHVYNLQTPAGYYSANGIITHNCRCTFVPTSEGPLYE